MILEKVIQREKEFWYYYNGDRYEGDIKDGKKDGKGVWYYNNGDRALTEFFDDFPVEKHIIFTKSGEIKEEQHDALFTIEF